MHLYISIHIIFIIIYLRVLTLNRVLHVSPSLHNECKLAGSWLPLFLLFQPRTQLSLKNFEIACASEQSQFPSDSFLINVTKAFQPGTKRSQRRNGLKAILGKLRNTKLYPIYIIAPTLL